MIRQLQSLWRGYSHWRYNANWPSSWAPQKTLDLANPLRTFFDARKEGPGIWKWEHYFDIYDRHFSKFRGQAVRILEIGIYSGGSLEMWRDYFGPCCEVIGIDIEPSCKAHESDFVKVYIDDQGDRAFWNKFKLEVPPVDIVIDDGGHLPEQQVVTFEESLPYLRPGSVYLCEDIHSTFNTFPSYVYGFAHNLNASQGSQDNLLDNEKRLICKATPVQSAIHSIHLYPYVVVVEKTKAPVSELVAPKHGTQWQPFLK